MSGQGSNLTEANQSNEYQRILRTRWWIVVVTTVVVVGLVGLALLFQPAEYLAHSDVQLDSTPVNGGPPRTVAASDQEVATQVQVVQSAPVAQLVVEQLGAAPSADEIEGVMVEAVNSAQVIRITVLGTNPDRVAELANAVADSYVKYRQERAGPTGSHDTVLRSATVPTEPVSPRPIWDLSLALVFGLLLGFGIAFLRARVDDVVVDENDVRSCLHWPQIVARIPSWRPVGPSDWIISLHNPRSRVAEAYSTTAANLRALTAPDLELSGQGQVVLLVSAGTGNDGALMACNVAVAAARLGSRVVLVDADLRRRRATLAFGLSDSAGLSELLGGSEQLSPAICDVGVARLRVLPAGQVSRQADGLLSNPRMPDLISELRADADLVLLTSAPQAWPVDMLRLSAHADLTVAVARLGVTREPEISSLGLELGRLQGDPTGRGSNWRRPTNLGSRTYRGSVRQDPALARHLRDFGLAGLLQVENPASGRLPRADPYRNWVNPVGPRSTRSCVLRPKKYQ